MRGNFMKFNIKIGTEDNAEGILNALKLNLIEIKEVDNISEKQRKKLEEEGFLRKEVDLDYYKNLIEDPDTDIYIAKDSDGKIIGFASIHKKIFNIIKVRDVIGNLSFENKESNVLLLNDDTEFAYLDQVSILPEFKRKGIGTAIFQQALTNLNSPVVAFIVEKPLFNKILTISFNFD